MKDFHNFKTPNDRRLAAFAASITSLMHICLLEGRERERERDITDQR